METPSPTTIDSVRSLMPTATLYLLRRPLTEAEGRIVAERQATKMLELLGITKPSVEIELILELPNIEVEVLPELPWSGYSEWRDDHWHIQINADDSLWRCRSSLAHEFKHILDDPFREELYPDWPHGSPHTPPEQAESICEYFAGCALVPRQWLAQAWDSGIRDPASLASIFDVSQSLINVRIDQTRVNKAEPKRRWRGYTRHACQPGTSLIRTAQHQLGHQHKPGATRRAKTPQHLTGEKYAQHALHRSVATTAV